MATKAFEGLLEDEKIQKYLKANPQVAQDIINIQNQSQAPKEHSTLGRKILIAVFVFVCALILWQYFTEVQTLNQKIQNKTHTQNAN